MKDHLASILIPLLSISALMAFEAMSDKKDEFPPQRTENAAPAAASMDLRLDK